MFYVQTVSRIVGFSSLEKALAFAARLPETEGWKIASFARK